MDSHYTTRPFFRIWLTTIDHFFAFAGFLANHFAQSNTLSSYNANSTGVTIDAAVCMETIAGHLLATMFLQVVLLRVRPNDLTVWKCVQASILIVDVWMVGAMCKALNRQDRVGLSDLRSEEWTNIGITGTMGAIRVLFLMSGETNDDEKIRKE